MNRFLPNLTRLAAAAALTVGGFAFALPASADVPGAHPAYLHGLQDLRVAAALVAHGDGDDHGPDQRAALRDIRAAYGDARRAAAFDGKDLDDRTRADADFDDNRGRLRHALDAVNAAHRDFTEYESNGTDRGWQHATVVMVDRAAAHLRRALAYADHR